ncbi:MAG TPA: hypothetical protein PLX66_02880 [Bacilli bacterium]|nr:hypothetical protein [Bacilli bacterium]
MKKILWLFLAFLFLIPLNVKASDKVINLHLFYGSGCSHCAAEIEFLEDYLKTKEDVKLYKYETWYNVNNQNKLLEVKELLDNDSNGVPFLVIGNKVILGYLEGTTDEQIKDAITYYENNNYTDTVGRYMGLTVYDDETTSGETEDDTGFTVPLLGKIDAKSVSLPLLAIIIGLVDGFNPCAMWILIFLIAMLFGMKDRKKMWILGLTFIVSSGLVYALFMVSWLSLTTFLNTISYIKIGIGIFAFLFGLINIYNYFKKRKEPVGCEVVDEKKRSKIMDKIRKIVSSKSFFLAIIGIILLAFSVNLIELLCSLGLPVIFTQVLSLNELSNFEYFIYIFIYILFFLIDDIIIFVIAMKTLKLKGISNKYTKYSHLIGGIIMLIIGILMIFKPEWLMFNF